MVSNPTLKQKFHKTYIQKRLKITTFSPYTPTHCLFGSTLEPIAFCQRRFILATKQTQYLYKTTLSQE